MLEVVDEDALNNKVGVKSRLVVECIYQHGSTVLGPSLTYLLSEGTKHSTHNPVQSMMPLYYICDTYK